MKRDLPAGFVHVVSHDLYLDDLPAKIGHHFFDDLLQRASDVPLTGRRRYFGTRPSGT
ncbi:MAG TPA: hypothetical protein VN786_10565 [Acidimicrobiales bacterium]|nr:hypothetical protein [Acidimicrobiales bacterium]